ncbi:MULTISPECIES: hypothetical protein [unclassified Roseobacter]|uniref:hypothetical protein n=1 Tax=unclassified Roseobacter TaxID=196798 RepID=UPI0030EECD0F
MIGKYTIEAYLIFILAIVCLLILSNIISLNTNGFLWDLDVYTRAVNDYSQGVDPYRDDVGFLFVYHPYVLKFFSFLSHILRIELWLLALYFISTIFFFREFIFFSRSSHNSPSKEVKFSVFSIILVSLCYGGAGLTAIQTGNITIFLHFFLLAVFLNSYRKKSLKKYYFLAFSIFLSSIVKPYLLAYVIIFPCLSLNYRVLYFIPAVIFASAAIWLSGPLLAPDLFEKFMSALKYQTIGKGDLGYTIFGLIAHRVGEANGIIIHTFTMLFFLISFIVYLKNFNFNFQSERFFPLIIVFVIFVNPRMKIYDFPIAVLFGYYYLWSSSLSLFKVIRVIAFSLFISSTPLLSAAFRKFGIFEPSDFLLDPRLFQIIGFSFIFAIIVSSVRKLPKHEDVRSSSLR